LASRDSARTDPSQVGNDGWFSSIAPHLEPEDISAGIAILDKVAGAALDIV
jgi:hypothetical protein